MQNINYCSYLEFPENEITLDDAKVIKAQTAQLNVKITHNIVYTQRANKELSLELLEPYRISNETHFQEKVLEPIGPTIVYVPGSAWHKQDIVSAIPLLYKYAERGYTVAIVEYRPTEDQAYFPSQVLDVKEAIRFLKSNAKNYAIDPDNMFIFGDSSGGHTALLVAHTGEKYLLESSAFTNDCHVNGIIDFYGPTNILTMQDYRSIVNHTDAESPEGYLIGQKNVTDNMYLAQETIVSKYITHDSIDIPTLIVHGTKDRIVPYHQSVELYEYMKALNKEAKFYALKGADHGGNVFWVEEIIDIVDGFIKAQYD